VIKHLLLHMEAIEHLSKLLCKRRVFSLVSTFSGDSEIWSFQLKMFTGKTSCSGKMQCVADEVYFSAWQLGSAECRRRPLCVSVMLQFDGTWSKLSEFREILADSGRRAADRIRRDSSI
jgi:hypothetical protein